MKDCMTNSSLRWKPLVTLGHDGDFTHTQISTQDISREKHVLEEELEQIIDKVYQVPIQQFYYLLDLIEIPIQELFVTY